MYKLAAYDVKGIELASMTEDRPERLYFGFDIWRDGSLDESGTWDRVVLAGDYGAVILEGDVIR